MNGQPGDKIKTVTSLIKLHHKTVGCYLHSHSTQLPKWLVNNSVNNSKIFYRQIGLFWLHCYNYKKLNVSLNYCTSNTVMVSYNFYYGGFQGLGAVGSDM